MDCSMPGSSVLHCLLEFAQIHIHWVGSANHLIHCHPLFFLPSLFPSIRVFSDDLPLCIRWAKCWSFSFSISPSNNYPGLISIRIDWFDLCAVQGTVKSLLQHQNLKAWILWCSAFFMVQLSHWYMTTGKTIALMIWTFVGKAMSLLFNMLFFNYMGAVTFCSDFGAQENKICHCFHFFQPICQKVMVPDAMILDFWMLSFRSAFSLSSFTFIKKLFSLSSLSAIRVVSSAYLRLFIFLP